MQPETDIQPIKTNERRSANWDLQNAFGNYATLVISQIAVAFFSFASVTLCTRDIGAEGYGGIVAIIAASSIAQIFVNWTCLGLARFGVGEFVESGKISKSFWARTIIFLPNTLIFLMFSLLWFPLLANWLKLPTEAFWLVVLHFIVTTCWLHVQHAFQGAKLPKLQGSFLAFERVLIFSALASLALSGNLTWISAVWAYIFPPFLMTVIGLWQIRNLISWKIDFDREIMRKMLKFSIPLIPFSLIGYFSTSYLDAIFISQYLSKTELGIYSVAYQISGMALQLVTLASSLLMPLFATFETSVDSSKIEDYLVKKLPVIILILGICFASLIFVITLLVPYFFNQKFENINKLLWILFAANVFSAILSLGYLPISFAKKYSDIGFYVALVAALTNVSLDFILIPRFGLIGCAYATLASSFVFCLVFIGLIHRRINLRLTWIWQTPLPFLTGVLSISFFNSNLLCLIIISCMSSCILYFYKDSLFSTLRMVSNRFADRKLT